jgi:dipeptidyl aminopeptidase/acylaminoacyl peptidase
MPLRLSLPLVLLLCLGMLAPGIARAQQSPIPAKLDGMPPIPAWVDRALNCYLCYDTGRFQGWLGGTRRMLLGEIRGDLPQLRVLWDDGHAQRVLTRLKHPLTSVCPNPILERLVLSFDNDGDDQKHLELFDLKTGQSHEFTSKHCTSLSPVWSRSGQLLAFSSNARNGRDFDLYVLRPPDRTSGRRLWKTEGLCAATDWSPDDRRLVAIEWTPSGETNAVLLIDVVTGQTTRAAAPPVGTTRKGARWSADGGSLYWLTKRDSGVYHLARYDIATSQETLLGPMSGDDVEGFDLSTDGLLLAYRVNQQGYSWPHLFDTVTGRELPLRFPPGRLFDTLSFRPNSHELTVEWMSAQSSTGVSTYEVRHGWWKDWIVPRHADEADTSMSDHVLIRYKSFDGRLIPAFVRKPGTKFHGRRPVLIRLHGGPALQYRPSFSALENVLLGELGIAQVMPNVRGSSGDGPEFEHLDDGRGREGAIQDVGALLDWIATQPDLDPARVAVSGESYGGYLALESLERYGDRFRAGIDIMGVSDLVSMLESAPPETVTPWRLEFGDVHDPATRAFLHEISPMTHVDRIRCPLLVIHGRNDRRVRFDQAEKLVAAVRANGQSVWFISLGGEGHRFDTRATKALMSTAPVFFLNRFLLGRDETPPVERP